MSLRRAYAAVLQLVRARRGLSQHDIAVTVTQSHISQLEALKTSATLEVSQELASALNLHPISFLTLVQAAQDQKSARDILEEALQELEAMALLDEHLPLAPQKLRPPQTEDAAKKWEAVQALKSKGHTQAEAVRMLGIPRSTVGRHWYRKNDASQ
ncbi:helix-turn-helix domain-containing protein [Pseudomonas fluorescens]|jgi:transcriptional regulator with XRE-family HTH domain|uniref:helix-turn-helix domain-containing protein n=1 Tax=Pseudomonas fluorescens TaxID=294 RepID=UPI001BE4F661|nr:helix-turn-helix transcriptional regulator [Pseudomonas fluorescens]MBT2371312.1 helix-turn-helix transcriptional regulator [Pseudomonas fluorescens]